jgi:hypothetical protein
MQISKLTLLPSRGGKERARCLLRSADQAEAHILLAKIHERNGDPYAVQADVAAYLKLYPHGPLEHEANALLQRAQEEISRRADASR